MFYTVPKSISLFNTSSILQTKFINLQLPADQKLEEAKHISIYSRAFIVLDNEDKTIPLQINLEYKSDKHEFRDPISDEFIPLDKIILLSNSDDITDVDIIKPI